MVEPKLRRFINFVCNERFQTTKVKLKWTIVISIRNGATQTAEICSKSK